MTTAIAWVRACESHACVNVAIVDGYVLVRGADDGPVLSFTHDEWHQFVAGAKQGMFDVPER